MTTKILNIPMHNATVADFRAWGSAVSQGFADVGLVKVNDTGTVNWSTVAAPSVNFSAGWEIWRFADAAQAQYPIFFKIEYGALNGATAPGLWITVGGGSDGSGNITSVYAPRRPAQPYSSSVGTAYPTNAEPIYISSDGSSLCFVARLTTQTSIVHGLAFIVDRVRDSSGLPTALGGAIFTEGSGQAGGSNSSSTSMPAQVHAWSNLGTSIMSDVPAVMPTQINGISLNSSNLTSFTMSNGEKVPVLPYLLVVPGLDPWQSLAAMCFFGADGANGSFVSKVLGADRTYRAIPLTDAHSRWATGRDSVGASGLCILWES